MKKKHWGMFWLAVGVTVLLCGCGEKTEIASVSEETVISESEITEVIEPVTQETEEKVVFTEDIYPVMDGSTSLKPLGVKITSRFLNISEEEAKDKLIFHKTDESYNYLLNNWSDILIAAEGCEAVKNLYEEENFQYDIEPIAMEALVFVVNKNNPVDSLTVEQIKKIYSGEITNWAQVGGDDINISAFQRNEESGSQVMMRKCVMTDTEMMEAPTELIPETMGGLIEGVAAYDNSSAAIGYTVYYYADSMRMAEDLKIIRVDDIEPCNETIASGEYPFINPYYCLIRKNEGAESPARIIFDWLVGEEGQQMVADSGYVPANALLTVLKRESSELDENGEIPIKRLKAEFMREYVAGTSNGFVYPILLQTVGAQDYVGGAYYKYGLVDESGTLVCDGVYTYVGMSDTGWKVRLENKWYLISFDGKVVIPYEKELFFDGEYYFSYDHIVVSSSQDAQNKKIGENSYEEIRQIVYDRDGNKLSDKILNIDHSIQKDYLDGYDGYSIRLSYGYDSNRHFITLTTDSLEFNPDNYEDDFLFSIYDVEKEKIIFSTDKSVKMFENETFVVSDFWGAEPSAYLLNSNGNRISDDLYYSIDYLGGDCYSVRKAEAGNYFLFKLKDGQFQQLMELQEAIAYNGDGFIEIVDRNLIYVRFMDYDGNEINPSDNSLIKCRKNAFDVLSKDKDEASAWSNFSPSKDPITGRYYAKDNSGNIYDCENGKIIHTLTPYAIIEPSEWNPDPEPLFRAVYLYNDAVITATDLSDYVKPINIKTGKLLFDYSIFHWENED